MNKLSVSNYAKRQIIALCLTLLISTIMGTAFFLFPLQAKAATTNVTPCQGQYCEGLDPQTAGPQGVGCAPLDGIILQQSDIVASLELGHAPVKVAEIYLWTSPTCGTNWGQVINMFNCRGCTVTNVQIARNVPTPKTERGLWVNIFPGNQNDAKEDHTYMIYAPTQPVQFCATVQAGSNPTDGTPIMGTSCITQPSF